eukprot:NODE_245_length_12995_cov_0.297922.p8 type:complete len:121 gc:universal NODE_245_length_12995_cov_0.297922:11097-10735(-)
MNHSSSFYCPIHPGLFVKQLAGSGLRYKFLNCPLIGKSSLCVLFMLCILVATLMISIVILNVEDPDPLQFGGFLLSCYLNEMLIMPLYLKLLRWCLIEQGVSAFQVTEKHYQLRKFTECP